MQLFICSAAYIIGALLSWRSLVVVGNKHFFFRPIQGITISFHVCCPASRETNAAFHAGLVPCAVLLVGLFFIPESPRWLVRR